MRQLSFYSVDARRPVVNDLAGLLCGPGQTVRFGRGTSARLSLVAPDRWRVVALAAECAARGVIAELSTTQPGTLPAPGSPSGTGSAPPSGEGVGENAEERAAEAWPLLRTAFRADLAALATAWTRGAVKAVPDGFVPDGPTLRLWAQAAGRCDGRGYLFGLDPHAPDTHEPLGSALAKAGITAVLLGTRGGGPALRVTGRRRMGRLIELIGASPPGAPHGAWPLD